VGAYARNDRVDVIDANMTRRMPSVFIGAFTGPNLTAMRVQFDEERLGGAR
jgi:hypothetical protein